jgi:histidinol-phosphate aminotransferase
MADVLPVAPRPEIRAMAGYHSPQVDVAVRLNTNESPFPPPPQWQADLGRAVANIDFHRYPDRAAAKLRSAIAGLHGVSPDQVFVANGSNEVLQTLCLTFGGTGRIAVTFEPTYAMHSQIARISGSTVVSGERDADHTLSIARFDRTIGRHDPMLVFLCSPNNPTGLLESPELIRHAHARTRGLVIVDEAYGQFAPWSAQELLEECERIVVIRTFSKTWSMAGARLGYCIARPWVIAELEKVVLPYHLDVMKQIAGELALHYEPEMRGRVQELVAERSRLQDGLQGLNVEFWPSQANFILFRPKVLDATCVWQQLVDRSVLVRNCAAWPGLHGCLRVTVGTRSEDDAFLTALEEIVGKTS